MAGLRAPEPSKARGFLAQNQSSMKIRKNTQLLLAYTLLFGTATGAICYDANVRSNQPLPLSEAEIKAAKRRADGNFESRAIVTPPAGSTSLESAREQSTGTQLPHGVFVVTDTTSATATDGTTHDLTAGTQVTLLRREGAKMKVTHDGFDFLVEEGQVTRNMETVGKLLAAGKS